jgi:hypothetical protein
MTRFTDEQLMAFADGESVGALGNEISEALRTDPELKARLAVFEESRRALRKAFEVKRTEIVPDRLMTPFGRPAPTPAPRVRTWAQRRHGYGLALAASILAAVALSIGYVAGGRPETTVLPDSQFLAEALEKTPGGVPFVHEQGAVRRELVPIRTVRTQGAIWCREFRLAEVVDRAVTKLHGLACRGAQGGWSMRALLAPSALPSAPGSADGSYRLAAGPDAPADLGVVETINSARETELIAHDWR